MATATQTHSTKHIAAETTSQESFITRAIITPVLFISFLVSLVLVDKDTYKSVLSGHDSLNKSETYYHSHQRKLAKNEVDRAFQRRGHVVALGVGLLGIAVAATLWVVVRAWEWVVGGKYVVLEA